MSRRPPDPLHPSRNVPFWLRRKRGDNLPRLPDDQVEGTVWEYKGTLKDKVPEGEEAPELSGYFRTEGKAIFDVGKRLPIPEKKDVDKAIDSFKKGKVKDFKLPPDHSKSGWASTVTSRATSCVSTSTTRSRSMA